MPARVEDVAVAAQLAILGEVAARLAHEPHGRAIHGLAAAGAQEPVGGGGSLTPSGYGRSRSETERYGIVSRPSSPMGNAGLYAISHG